MEFMELLVQGFPQNLLRLNHNFLLLMLTLVRLWHLYILLTFLLFLYTLLLLCLQSLLTDLNFHTCLSFLLTFLFLYGLFLLLFLFFLLLLSGGVVLVDLLFEFGHIIIDRLLFAVAAFALFLADWTDYALLLQLHEVRF